MAIEKDNELEKRKATAENNVSLNRGKISRLNDKLDILQSALTAANVGGILGGAVGRTIGVSTIPELEREINQVQQDIARVNSEIDKDKQIIDWAKHEQFNQRSLIRQLRQDKRSLGCR